MADILVMLALSPTMEEGQLVKWHKNEGDEVASGDVVAEVETDKATMELESFLDGVVLKRLVEEGTSVPVGAAIAVIGEEGEDISDVLSNLEGGGGGEDGGGAPDEATDSGDVVPGGGDDDDDDDDEGGEDAETPAPKSAQRKADQASGKGPGRAKKKKAGGDGRVIASPLARKMAEERGIDLAEVDGSGPQGRIIKRDIEAWEPSEAAPGRAAPAAAPASFTPDQWAEDVEPTPLSSMRRTIARRLGQSWMGAPHFFLEMSIRMDAAAALRKQINDTLTANQRGKISFNDLVIKACALALQEVPEVNVAFADDGIRQFAGSHIGVAVSVSEGLIVPVVRDAHQKALSQIGAEVRDLAGRARDKKLKPQEMTGSTFSISNLGMFGIDAFTAVINPPEACILAVGAIKKEPVVDEADDSIRVARVMRVTLSCDHRAVDGALGAEFLGVVRTYLENPLLLVS